MIVLQILYVAIHLFSMEDVTYEAMDILMNYFYDRKLFEKDISSQLLEEVLILANYLDLSDLLCFATNQIFYMIYNPRLRFSVRRRNQDLKKWANFASKHQISHTKNRLTRELGLLLLGHIH